MNLPNMNVSIAEVENVLKYSECLLDARGVEAMMNRLSNEITTRCRHQNPVVLCVMIGAIVAVGRLLPKLNFPLEVDYIHATRYRRDTIGGQLEWKKFPSTPLFNRTVIIVDDVLDEGVTMAEIKAYCHEQGAKQCYLAVLVNKNIQQDKSVEADFIGIQAGNQYLFGLGMDYKGYLRNVEGIYARPDNFDELVCQD